MTCSTARSATIAVRALAREGAVALLKGRYTLIADAAAPVSVNPTNAPTEGPPGHMNDFSSDFTAATYKVDNGLAWITINRPDRYNAFRARTVDELVKAFKHAWGSNDVGAIALTGAGNKAFCAGGDQKQRMETGDYGPSDSGLFEVEALHRVIRDVTKPVIAAVNGVAVGGGHVLHLLCDLTITTEDAIFGQNGPRVGSFDAGLGTGYLARTIGDLSLIRPVLFVPPFFAVVQRFEEWRIARKVSAPARKPV